MGIFDTFILIFAFVCIFIWAIHKFSNQIHYLGAGHLKEILSRFTGTPLKGVLTGVVVTSVLQSSTATSVMLVSLVNAGMISFSNSLGVVFGANIGTTITSQLIALKVTEIAPYIVIVGFLLLTVHNRYQRFSRIIFYFGIIFLCFYVISILVEPLKQNPILIEILSHIQTLPIAIIAGLFIAVLFQSSSVASGLIIILVGQSILTFDQAFGMVLGANIGTTSTVLFASHAFNVSAKRVAWAHFLFNIIGVLAIIPFSGPFISLIKFIPASPAQQIANIHLIFNIFSTIVFLILLKPFIKLLYKIVKSPETE
jgi:phosphate:Na+ symporter